MKYISIILALFICTQILAIDTASSIPFSNSYLQRASGIEALYWNPANINKFPAHNELMIPFYPSFSFSAENKGITLGVYNQLMVDFLDENLKRKLTDAIDDYFVFDGNSRSILMGFSHGNLAYSSAINLITHARADKQFIEMAFHGNVYEKEYDFTHEKNDFMLLAYKDLTAGYGGFNLNQYLPVEFDYIPNIDLGVSASILFGLSAMEMVSFKGNLSTNDIDGVVLDQYTDIKMAGLIDNKNEIHGKGLGAGFKAAFGLSVDAYEFDETHYIKAGLTIDNIGAQIRWKGNTTNTRYYIISDSVHVATTDKEYYIQDKETWNIEDFTTRIPLNLKIGTLYRWNEVTASLDYSQYFGSTKAFNYDPSISLGLEYLLYENFPLQIGFRLPIGDLHATNSLGFGYRHRNFEIGFAMQAIGAFWSYNTEGVAFATQMKIRF